MDKIREVRCNFRLEKVALEDDYSKEVAPCTMTTRFKKCIYEQKPLKSFLNKIKGLFDY